MAGLLMGVLGGALQGVGEGMQEQAKMEGLMKREARLAELNHTNRLDEMRVSDGYQTARDSRQNQFQVEGDQRRFTQQKELAGINNGYQTARDATNRDFELQKIRAQTEAKATVADRLRSGTMGLSADDERQRKAIASTYGDDLDGYRKALASSGNPRLAALASGDAPAASGPPRAEMSTDDARVWNNVAPLYTDKITGATDTKGLQQHFLDLNRPDLAAIAAGNMSGSGPSRKEAWDRARKEADERAPGFFKSDKEAFPETGGNRDAWVAKREEALFAGRRADQPPPTAAGQGGAAGLPPASPPSTPQPSSAQRDPLAAARDAIGRGAPRDKVIERLRSMGINPAGL